MKTSFSQRFCSLVRYVILLLCVVGFVQRVRAGVTFQIQLYHHCGIGNEYYLLFPSVTTNNTSVNPADTGYFVWSSGSTANSGSHGQLYAGGGTDSGSSGYPTYDAFIQEITNRWTLQVTNATATNIYHFSVGGFPSNMLPAVSVTFPADQATEVTNLPVFAWQGPTNYPELYVQVNNTDYSFAQGTYLPPIETYWACPTALASGSNYYFGAYYNSNADATITATIPTNNLGQVFSGWESSCRMQAYGNSYFTVAGGLSGPSTGGHRLLAHYSFDDSNGIGSDNSGNANDLNGGSWWGQNHQFSTDAVAGGGAVEFHGASSLNPSDNTRTNWNLTLASSFTISAWVKTTAITGADTNDAISGAAILWAYNDIGGTNDTIPLAISGSKAAFSTRDHSGITTTLHSTNSVTDGSYHMITITRDALTGEKRIYVDGNLNGSEIGTTDRLNGNTYFLSIGGTTYASYSGILDDVQIYAGVLSADEIAALHDNPGTTTTNKPPIGLQARYDFDEGTVVAPDMSGNGNPILHAGQFSGTGSNISTDSVSGGGSIHFDGGSYLTASTNILSTLAGSFSISLWLKTDQSTGNPGDLAWDGAGIVTADSPDPGSKDLIPIALTAGQVAFNIGDGNADNTLNSTAAVNDNQWHHVVVTRNQSTGERQLFIDGVLDTSDTASTELLDSPVLLFIGAKSDAADPDPASPDFGGSNGYDGLLDDIQFYDRPLSASDVAFLHANPGATVGYTTNAPYPVDVSLQFFITRSQDPQLGEIYGGSVSFDSVSPAPTTTNSVHSPHNYFATESYPGGGSGFGAVLYTLDDVINEFTNGSWTLYINQGSPTQQVYTFQIAITGLDTNVLQAVRVFTPTNGSINVSLNPAFHWIGPTNFSTLVVDLLSGPVAILPSTATNWAGAPALSYGTNRFDVNYTSNNFPGVSFTSPAVNSWSATLNLSTASFNNFVVGEPAPMPVRITGMVRINSNIQFSFQTLAGRPHTIETRTNLTSGVWIPLTNFTGDGSLRQFTFPATTKPVEFFRINTQ